MVKRVVVIGAGSSGLTCIKTCIDEGLEPVCFECSDDIGGLWKFKESDEPNSTSIYRSLVTNTSKEIMCFSDFPMPGDYPNYMHHSLLLQYFRLYAKHFDLLRYIHFQTTVRSVRQKSDFSQSGQWDVVTVNKDGKEEKHVFDAVLVCSGHYTHPNLPLADFPGHEIFSGKCYHSCEYKDAKDLSGKRVVVVGIGNSAADIAVDISRYAEKTFLSTRGGVWVLSRLSFKGLPMDMVALTRFSSVLSRLLPKNLLNWTLERALNNKYDHRLYSLMPKHRILERKALVNDDLPARILQGAVVMKTNLKEFQRLNILFEDGTVEDNIDTVIFCTGYHAKFPFLPPPLSGGPCEELTLYKRVFPPCLEQPTLAFMGVFLQKGPINPTVEMQARWAVKVFSGLKSLPAMEKMLTIIDSDRKENMKIHPCPRDATLHVNFIPYLDFMAEEVGVRPNLLRIFLRDPVLWMKVFFGPCTPYQYRLSGPRQWEGARQAILTQWERVVQPFKTRPIPEPRPSILFSPWLIPCGVMVLIVVISSQRKVSTVLQGVTPFMDKCRVFLEHSWLTPS
ncbi:dimethylaniline monooxygenase [N-oxide-forming] 2-like isoform X1 [Thalassophryne amazonica]|uniref:dimethylaniline monooxygenase [N-oxide-forming] 2-like isoform X1 n=1 Tax=Thalassophryne amazonica TaxID=390379 RepID=UPI001470BE35|nr:dimethylaniline monooxygenase [N-oxide-forming] 2-like isoform X1 [Thalassophryne amazonica]